MSEQKAWTWNDPVREDATDAQLIERITNRMIADPCDDGNEWQRCAVKIAREYAAACVAAPVEAGKHEMDPPIIYGKPHTHCDDCGTKMVWSSEQKESWMCPLCVLRRMHAAEDQVRRAVAASSPRAWETDEAVKEALARVLCRICPVCGHGVTWHGENHDDGCTHSGCDCSLNARECDAKINDEANVYALVEAVAEAVSVPPEAASEPVEKVLRDTETYRAMLAQDRYPANFREQAKGVEGVVLPLGSTEAVTRLLRDLVAWGFGMGQAQPESSELLSWHERADATTAKLREHFAASQAENLLLGLHKIVADLAPYFDKPLTEESMPRWLALDSAQKTVAQYFAASQGEAERGGEAAEGALSANADAIEVRKRFDVLMERMDEFYDQGMWDAQVVAFYLVQEARAANRQKENRDG